MVVAKEIFRPVLPRATPGAPFTIQSGVGGYTADIRRVLRPAGNLGNTLP